MQNTELCGDDHVPVTRGQPSIRCLMALGASGQQLVVKGTSLRSSRRRPMVHKHQNHMCLYTHRLECHIVQDDYTTKTPPPRWQGHGGRLKRSARAVRAPCNYLGFWL